MTSRWSCAWPSNMSRPIDGIHDWKSPQCPDGSGTGENAVDLKVPAPPEAPCNAWCLFTSRTLNKLLASKIAVWPVSFTLAMHIEAASVLSALRLRMYCTL
jgi:hypothetical protein